MTRVLLVGKGEPDRGGIAAFLHMMLTSELASRYEIDFLNVANRDDKEGGSLSIGNLRRTMGDTVAVWRRSRDVDIVHIHSALAPMVTMLRAALFGIAARLRGARVVVHGHGGRIELWLTTAARSWITRIALSPAHTVVTVSAGGLAALRRAGVGRDAMLIPNGVDLERFRPGDRRAGRPRVLYVGLLTPRKGVSDLLEAATLLRRRDIDCELRLVGGAPDEGREAEEQVRAAAVGAGADFFGTVEPNEMPALYRDADVFCLPSWYEAAPLSVLEAMASGLAVVATPVGEIPTMVDDDATGTLVPVREPRALADALAGLLTDVDRRARMGRAGRHRVEQHYDLRTTVAAIGALYERIAESR